MSLVLTVSLVNTVLTAAPAPGCYQGREQLYSQHYGKWITFCDSLLGGRTWQISDGIQEASDVSDDAKKWEQVPSVPQKREVFGRHHYRNVARRERKKAEGAAFRSADWRGGIPAAKSTRDGGGASASEGSIGVSGDDGVFPGARMSSSTVEGGVSGVGGVASVCGGCGGSVAGGCGSTGSVASAVELEAKETLAARRAMENKLATRKAELALARMSDPVFTELHNDRVKQETLCRMNQAVQKSEKSLEQLRSVSPGSSATPGEIREALLNSEAWKLKEKKIRAWIAAGRPEGGDLAILDEGKSTEVESLDTEDRALLAEYGTGSEADEDRYVEPSQAMKDETARVIRLSHKRHVEYVIRRLRGTGRDPASNLIGAELEYYQAMTAEEIANVV